jgi:putative phosphoesterase
MAVKIGLLSDVHATEAPLQETLAIFRYVGVEQVLCAGDVAGYGDELERSIALLREDGCLVVLGNHDLWWSERHRHEAHGEANEYLRGLPERLEFSAAGKTICMVHASPLGYLMEGIRLLDEDATVNPQQRAFWSDYLQSFAADVLVVGHTHQVFVEQLGHPLVVNPGSTRFNHTCAILTLPELTIEFLPLSGRTPVLSWNWGMEGAEQWSRDAGRGAP